MRDEPNNLLLFDDGLNDEAHLTDEERLKRDAWDCAEAIFWSTGRKNIRSSEIKNLMEALIDWCLPCKLNGEHWTPQRQMDWLKRRVRDKGEAVSLKDLKRIRDDKFNPPPPPANSFAEADRIWEECKARAITRGKCPRCLGEGIKRDGNFCECSEGETERAAEAKREEERRNQRSVPRPPSIGGFGVNLEVLHPTEVGRQRKRAAKPTGKDWADTTPTLERLQCLLQKNASQWSVEDKVFLSRFDKTKRA